MNGRNERLAGRGERAGQVETLVADYQEVTAGKGKVAGQKVNK